MFHRVQRLADRLLFFVAIAFLLTGNAAPPASFDATVDRIVGADRFEFVRWEIEALAEKGADASVPLQDYLSDEQRAQFVVDYLARTRQLFAVERDVDRIYSDPKVTNPDAASVDQRAKRDQLRAEVDQRRSTAEAIVEEQISAVLADAGFAVGGRVFPPVQARVTPLPYILIISPRDRIEREEGLDLSAGMTVDRAEAK